MIIRSVKLQLDITEIPKTIFDGLFVHTEEHIWGLDECTFEKEECIKLDFGLIGGIYDEGGSVQYRVSGYIDGVAVIGLYHKKEYYEVLRDLRLADLVSENPTNGMW